MVPTNLTSPLRATASHLVDRRGLSGHERFYTCILSVAANLSPFSLSAASCSFCLPILFSSSLISASCSGMSLSMSGSASTAALAPCSLSRRWSVEVGKSLREMSPVAVCGCDWVVFCEGVGAAGVWPAVELAMPGRLAGAFRRDRRAESSVVMSSWSGDRPAGMGRVWGRSAISVAVLGKSPGLVMCRILGRDRRIKLMWDLVSGCQSRFLGPAWQYLS